MNRPVKDPCPRAAAAGACLLAATLCIACEDPFSPYNRLDKLRVLALQSEPVDPGPGQTTRLTPLVYVPPGETASYAWSWCPFAGPSGDGYPCLVDESTVVGWSNGLPAPPPFDLGGGETASLPNTLAPELLRELCTGSAQGVALPTVPKCDGGFPVLVQVVVRTSQDEVRAVRTVRLRFDEAAEPNLNPLIDGVALVVNDQESPVDEAGATVVPRETELGVNISVADETAERFTDHDELGQPLPARERLFFTWFVEGGKTKEQRTLFIEGVTTLADATENRWTTPALANQQGQIPAHLIVVARDSRGGVSWRKGLVTVEGTP